MRSHLHPERPFILCFLLESTTLLVGCGHGSAEPPRLSGHYGPHPLDVTALRTAQRRPDGVSSLGEIRTRCRADVAVDELDHAALADVDCSEDLLLRALYTRAAEVGADLLVAPACDRDEDDDGVTIECDALAAHAGSHQSDDGAPFEPLAPLSRPAFASAEDAFRVKVSARLAPGERPRPAVASDGVAELAFASYGRVPRASIVARGEEGAGPGAVRHAVRAAAGRVGGTEVAGIECAERERGVVCVGQAFRPEADEQSAR